MIVIIWGLHFKLTIHLALAVVYQLITTLHSRVWTLGVFNPFQQALQQRSPKPTYWDSPKTVRPESREITADVIPDAVHGVMGYSLPHLIAVDGTDMLRMA